MLVDVKSLQADKFYYCVSDSKEKNRWLTKGKITKIFLGSEISDEIYASQSVKQTDESSTLSDSVQWEVREATDKEKEWIVQCMYERKLVDRPYFVERCPPVYEIF